MAAPVTNIKPHLASITCPDALRKLPGWLIWRYEHKAGEPKPRKVPYYTNGERRHGVQGRPEDRQQLTTFDAARAAAARRGFDGVGLALMPEFNIVALDFDHCVAEGGIHPEVERLVAGTYAEYSPSGEGVRAFMRGQVRNNRSPLEGNPYGFETFSTKGFVTFTGNVLDITELLGAENALLDLTDQVRAVCAQRFGRVDEHFSDDPLMDYAPPVGLTSSQLEDCLDVLDPTTDHNTWLSIGMAIHHETDGEGFELWNEWSAQGADKYPGREALQKRWDSFGQGAGKVVTARTLLKLAQENGAYINSEVASAAEFEALADAPTQPKEPSKLRYQVVQAAEFAQGKPPSWVIKGVLPKAELAVMFGESGSGKSFLALDMGAAIARGIDWRGRRTKQGRVVYIAAEGGGGFRKRLAAYAQHHQVDLAGMSLDVINAAPNFLQKSDAVDVAKAIVGTTGSADVIVVDTFAQVTPGANENSAEDIGKALAHCKGIHRATGAVVLLVHHAGKDTSKGSRGWSGLRAAADAEIEVVRTAAGRYVRISKQKDGDDQGEWGFDLDVVPIGVDEDGDVVDSCVVVEAAVPVMGKVGKSGRKMGEWEQLVYNVVQEFALAQSEGIEVSAVLDEAVGRKEKPEKGKRDTRKQHAKRALLALCQGDDAPFFVEDDCLTVLEGN